MFKKCGGLSVLLYAIFKLFKINHRRRGGGTPPPPTLIG